MIRELLVYLVASTSLAVAQVQLQFPCYGCTFSRVLQSANGNRLLVGSRLVTFGTGLSYVAGNPARVQIDVQGAARSFGLLLGGSGNDIPQAAAVDPSGNIWIVGNTDSDDFKLQDGSVNSLDNPAAASVPAAGYMTLRSTPPISLGYPPPITSNAWQIYTK